jgi:hypothetical protein
MPPEAQPLEGTSRSHLDADEGTAPPAAGISDLPAHRSFRARHVQETRPSVSACVNMGASTLPDPGIHTSSTSTPGLTTWKPPRVQSCRSALAGSQPSAKRASGRVPGRSSVCLANSARISRVLTVSRRGSQRRMLTHTARRYATAGARARTGRSARSAWHSSAIATRTESAISHAGGHLVSFGRRRCRSADCCRQQAAGQP